MISMGGSCAVRLAEVYVVLRIKRSNRTSADTNSRTQFCWFINDSWNKVDKVFLYPYTAAMLRLGNSETSNAQKPQVAALKYVLFHGLNYR